MGRTALYRDYVPPPRADVQLDEGTLQLEMPDGRRRRHALDGVEPHEVDGVVVLRDEIRRERRFVRMLVLEHAHDRHVLITPPDHGAVAPSVVRVPEAPTEAAILETGAFEAVSDFILGGGRLAAFSIPQLARLAEIASSGFAAVIGEVAARRALEIAWEARGPMRNGYAGYHATTESGEEVDGSLAPLVAAARRSTRAADALMAALSLLAGTRRRRRRF